MNKKKTYYNYLLPVAPAEYDSAEYNAIFKDVTGDNQPGWGKAEIPLWS